MAKHPACQGLGCPGMANRARWHRLGYPTALHFFEECKLANAPNPVMMGIQMLGPMLIHFGTEAQKQQFLPGIISGDDVWCQGY